MPSWLKQGLQLVAILVAAFLFVYLYVLLRAHSDDHGVSEQRLLFLVMFTAAVFLPVVAEFRASWRDIRFWLAVLGLFTLHVRWNRWPARRT